MNAKDELRKDIESRINKLNVTSKEIEEEFEVLVTRQSQVHADIAELRGIMHLIVTSKPISPQPSQKTKVMKTSRTDEEIRNWILEKKVFSYPQFSDFLSYKRSSREAVDRELKKFKRMIVQTQVGGSGSKPHIYKYIRPNGGS